MARTALDNPTRLSSHEFGAATAGKESGAREMYQGLEPVEPEQRPLHRLTWRDHQSPSALYSATEPTGGRFCDSLITSPASSRTSGSG